MIDQDKVALIERLLSNEKLSQRKIAKMTGVSRSTVAGIADGSRPDYSARQGRKIEVDEQEPAGPPVRCPGCGGRVYAPCRLCHVRRLKEEEKRKPRTTHLRNRPIASRQAAGCRGSAPPAAMADGECR